MSNLFQLGQTHFQSIIDALAEVGIATSPRLELCASDGLLFYYDLATQTIYLSLPDRDTNQGRLQMLLLRSLFDCPSNSEVLDFLQRVMRWLISHEVAHHCRHHYGLLSENIWQEEQIANYLAIAMSKAHFSIDDRMWCDKFLQRAIRNLYTKQANNSSIIDSYHSLPHSLHTAELIDTMTFDQIGKVRQATGYLSETILKNQLVDALPDDIEKRVHNRHTIIERINSGAYREVFEYLYYYFGWMHIGIMSAEHYSIQAFKQYFLNANHAQLLITNRNRSNHNELRCHRCRGWPCW